MSRLGRTGTVDDQAECGQLLPFRVAPEFAAKRPFRIDSNRSFQFNQRTNTDARASVSVAAEIAARHEIAREIEPAPLKTPDISSCQLLELSDQDVRVVDQQRGGFRCRRSLGCHLLHLVDVNL